MNGRAMNYRDYKDIEQRANQIGFALAKIVNNFCDVLTPTGLKEYISKGELLGMLYFDGAANMIKLRPDYRDLIFDAVSLTELSRALDAEQDTPIGRDKQQHPEQTGSDQESK